MSQTYIANDANNATTTFNAQDVLDVWQARREADPTLPELTLQQADAWLAEHARIVEEDMSTRGFASIETLLDLDDPTSEGV